jgi:putative heme transporter
MAVKTPPPAPGEPGSGTGGARRGTRDAAGRTGGFLKRHRKAARTVLGAAVIFGLVYYVIPQFAGLGPTVRRLRAGNLWWLGLGVVVEALSIGGDVVLMRGVFSRPGSRIGWKASYQITMAGAAATKLFATAGAGGIALTVWALRASGLSDAEVATRLVCFEILEYGVYMAALAIVGLGLWFGVFAGRAPVGITLIPAGFGLLVILIVLSMLFAEAPVERFLTARADRSSGRRQRWWRRAASVPRSLRSGLTAAIAMLRRRDPSLLGALASWGFDIAALWASFRAFGHSPPPAVLVMGYYVGTLGNALPLPGGIGGVEGGMIGAFLVFGVNGALTVLAVLAYRTISYWLPTVPGAIAYIRLRGTVNGWRSQPAGRTG